MDFRQLIIEEANRQKIDPNLALAVAQTESSFNPNAVSPKGAQGLFQLMPGTAKDLGVDPTDPQQNIRGGITYLRQQLDNFGDPKLALAAYNAGPGNVKKAGGVPNFPETQNYVSKIMGMLVPSAQAATPPNQQQAVAQEQTQTQEQPQSKKPFHERVVSGYGKALDNNDFEAAEVIVGEAKNRFKQGLDRALANNDKEAADIIKQKQSEAFTQLYDRSAKSGNLKLTEALRQEIRSQNKLTNESTEKDPIFTKNARILYREAEGKDFKGSDKEAADWLKNYMGQFNYNLAVTGKTALDVNKYSDQGKVAFLQAMNDYDSMPASLEGAGRLAKGIATDPTTYIGLGVGAVASKTAGRTAAKEGVKVAIQQGLEQSLAKRLASSTTAKLAAEGAVYSGAGNLLEQSAKVNAGGQDGINVGEAALATGLGAGAGVVGGKIIDKVTGRTAIRDFAKRAGSEEGTRLDAEIIKRMGDVADDPARFFGGKAPETLSAQTLNQAVTKSFLEPVRKVLNDIPKGQQPQNIKELRGALQNWKSLTEAERNALRGTPYGDAVADAIEKSLRSTALTAAQPAKGGALGTIARITTAAVPSVLSATTGIPVVVSGDLIRGIGNKLGGRLTREDVSRGLLNPRTREAADVVLQRLGRDTETFSAARDLADRAVKSNAAKIAAEQAAKTRSMAERAQMRNQVLETSKMPLGGGFQELLPGGASGLNLASGDAVRALRVVSKMDKNSPVSQAAASILKSEPVKDPNAFYGVQNTIRRLSEQGKIPGVTTPMGQATGSGIRNPVSYAANVRTAEEAAKLARESAPNKALSQLANKVAGTKAPADKLKLVEDRLAKATDPAEIEYLNNFVRPLTNFGKK